jgi:hypothetical protein
MESQSIKSVGFLLCILMCIFLSNLIIYFHGKKYNRLKTHSYLLHLNYFFPVFSYLSFSDQVDESYIWASKVQNLLSSGRMGVKLFDGTYGESSVSIIQPAISAVIKAMLPITYEQALYIPGIASIYILIYFWSKTAATLSLSLLSSTIPIGFLMTSYGFLQNVSLSFDVTISLLALFLVYKESMKSKSPMVWVSVLVSLTPLIRIEFLLLILLWIFAFTIEIYNRRIKLSTYLKSIALLLTPTLFACVYKFWAFGDLLPAMVHFKFQNYDLVSMVRIIAYYVRSLGYLATTMLAVGAFVYLINTRLKLEVKNLFLIFLKLPIFQKATLVFIGIQFLTPVLAGSDYHGERLQRYIIVPLSLSVFIYFMHRDFLWKESIRKTLVLQKGVTFFLILIISISLESHAFAIKEGRWFDIQSRPSRAHCDELIGPEIQKFWLSKSNAPLVIATSEANGISFSSGAKLLDLAGVVDARNYPVTANPISPGNLYGRYTFKDSIAKELPSILWPYKSEHCTFYNEIDFDSKIENSQLIDNAYSSEWARYWFPSLSSLSKLGFCPGRVEAKKENFQAVAAFLYYCKTKISP